MPQIIERKRQDGSIAYVAQIKIRRNGKWAHRESRIFAKHSSSATWFKKRMKEITATGDDLIAVKSKGRTLSRAIDRDITKSVKEIGVTPTPATCGNDISHPGAICAVARPSWGIPLDRQAIKDAFVVGNRLGIATRCDKTDCRYAACWNLVATLIGSK